MCVCAPVTKCINVILVDLFSFTVPFWWSTWVHKLFMPCGYSGRMQIHSVLEAPKRAAIKPFFKKLQIQRWPMDDGSSQVCKIHYLWGVSKCNNLSPWYMQPRTCGLLISVAKRIESSVLGKGNVCPEKLSLAQSESVPCITQENILFSLSLLIFYGASLYGHSLPLNQQNILHLVIWKERYFFLRLWYVVYFLKAISQYIYNFHFKNSNATSHGGKNNWNCLKMRKQKRNFKWIIVINSCLLNS